MNDKELFEDLLNSLKGACDLYMHGTIEAGTTQVNETFNETLFETLKLQNCMYNEMKNCGWYQPKNVDQSKINQAKIQASGN